MPADRKQVEEAVERLQAEADSAWEGHSSAWETDLNLLLTDHAALPSGAEAAEAALKPCKALVDNMCEFGGVTDGEIFDAAWEGLQQYAAHQQPAPVKAG